jgi:hypothetical protein
MRVLAFGQRLRLTIDGPVATVACVQIFPHGT